MNTEGPAEKFGVSWVSLVSRAFGINTKDAVEHADFVQVVNPFTQSPLQFQVGQILQPLLVGIERIRCAQCREVIPVDHKVDFPTGMPEHTWGSPTLEKAEGHQGLDIEVLPDGPGVLRPVATLDQFAQDGWGEGRVLLGVSDTTSL